MVFLFVLLGLAIVFLMLKKHKAAMIITLFTLTASIILFIPHTMKHLTISL